MLRLLRILFVSLLETLRARVSHGRALPSWHFRLEWMVRFLARDSSESMLWPYSRIRADFDGRRYPSPHASRVPRSASTLGGVPIVTFAPKSARHEAVLLYFHGGGYVFGSAGTTHADLIAHFALSVPVMVVAPEYRLAPEHPYPAALHDALAVFDALKAVDPTRRVLVAGDSAGANLALALQMALRDRGDPQADAALLISPWLDLTASRASCRDHERFDYGRSSFLARHARDFAGGIPLDDPRVSPINAPLARLAPLFVQVGGAERLRDETLEFVEKARAAGVDVELDLVPEMPHLPPVFAGVHPAARDAVTHFAEYARSRLG